MTRRFGLLLLTGLLLAGCGVNVRWSGIAEPPVRPEEARAVPMRFGQLQARLRRGEVIGEYVIGFTCLGPFDTITWAANRRLLDRDDVADIFYEELSAAGYDVSGNPGRLFDAEEDEERAELVVSAQVVDAKMNVCRKAGLAFIESYTTGDQVEASVRVDWTVYSRLERRMMLRTTTRGYVPAGATTMDGQELAMEQAFAAAVANLAADPGFMAVGFARPEAMPKYPALEAGTGNRRPVEAAVPEATAPILVADRAARLQAIRLPAAPPFRTPIQDHVEAVTAAAVTIANGAGHGSGVIVSRDGLVLTNAHVVADAERVRVVMADGSSLIGIVERRHRPRDVALVRVESGAPLPALPVRTQPLAVSEEVYAVGTPLRERLRGTVTRGIVSAFRRDRLTGLEQIQADVGIQPGNSGGPLVDGRGNLVGLTVAGYTASGNDTLVGLNLFIPIADVLDRLRLEPQP